MSSREDEKRPRCEVPLDQEVRGAEHVRRPIPATNVSCTCASAVLLPAQRSSRMKSDDLTGLSVDEEVYSRATFLVRVWDSGDLFEADRGDRLSIQQCGVWVVLEKGIGIAEVVDQQREHLRMQFTCPNDHRTPKFSRTRAKEAAGKLILP